MILCYIASNDYPSNTFVSAIAKFPKICESICFKDVRRMEKSPVMYVPTIVDDRCYVGTQAFNWLENRLRVPVSRDDPNIYKPVMSFSSEDGLITTTQQDHQPILHE